MNDTLRQARDIFDRILLGWLKEGVATEKFDDEGRPIRRPINDAEAEIIVERLGMLGQKRCGD